MTISALPPEDRPRLRMIPCLVVGTTLLACGIFAHDGTLFVWGDVAFVHLIGAIPGGMILANTLVRRFPFMGVLLLGIVIVGISAGLLTSLAQPHVAARWIAALCLTSGLLLTTFTLSPNSARFMPSRAPISWLFLAVLILILPPTLYGHVRFQRELTRLGELVHQSRFGEAQATTQQLLRWNASARWRGRSLHSLAQEFESLVAELSQEVQVPLSTAAPLNDQLRRARALAILGRNEEAVARLESLPPGTLTPAAHNLLATIHESSGNWSAASAWYQQGLAGSQATNLHPGSPEEAEVLRAWRGIGFNERKLGNLTDAEFAYLELLNRAPTADHHFLIGQFYEDIQRTRDAQSHIQRAIDLDPAQFRDTGEQLLQNLMTSHFSCLSAYRSR